MRFVLAAAFFVMISAILIAVTMIYQAAMCMCEPEFPLSWTQMIVLYLVIVFASLAVAWRD